MSAVTIGRDLASRGVDAADRRQRRINAFHPPYQRCIAAITNGEPALEDLADTFPALLFGLATGYAAQAERERTVALVRVGAPLREAADAFGLAWWLRKLPPGAFTAPLAAFPRDPAFGFRISGSVPRDLRLAPIWLSRVAHAFEACGAHYALWLARQDDLFAPAEESFLLMAAWAWFGGRRDLLGHRLLRRSWHADMSFRRAREELSAWRQRLRLIESLGPGIETPWLCDGAVSGFDFVALRTVDDFVSESEALDNCLDQYGDQLGNGSTAVFSIRKNGRSVACVEIGLHEAETTMPTIVQLRAARNRRAAPEIWQAAFAWLGSQRLEPLAPHRHMPRPGKRAEARRRLWEPYLAFLGGTPHEEPFRRAVMARGSSRAAVGAGRRGLRASAELQLRLHALGEQTGNGQAGADCARPGLRE